MTTYSVSDLRDRLALLDNKIAAAERAVEAAQHKLMQARNERVGAEAFINSLESVPEIAPQQQGNSSIVLAVLQGHPGEVRLDDIPRFAVELGGPELSADQVKAALKYLGRRGDAQNVRRGVWRAKIDIPRNTEGPAEAGPSGETSPRLTPEVNAG